MKRFFIMAWLLSAAPAMAGEKIAFSMPDTHGKVRTLAQYAGKWVVVNYWATNCAPCLKEIPELEAFHKKHKLRDAVVLGVNFEDIPRHWLKDFMDTVTMNYPVLPSDTSPDTPFGPVIGLPTTFIVSPAGELVARQTGALTAANLETFIQRQTGVAKTRDKPR